MNFAQTINLKLKAFDHGVLDKAVSDIVDAVSRIGAKFTGPIPLPNKIQKFTVNRSTHVHIKSREQYEIRSHARFLVIEASPQIVESLMGLDIASGVDIQIKMNKRV